MDNQFMVKTLESCRELIEGELIVFYHFPPSNHPEVLYKENLATTVEDINKLLEFLLSVEKKK